MTREELIEELYFTDRSVITGITRSPIRNQTDSSADKVLWIVRCSKNRITPTEICHMLDVSSPRVTTVLNSLEKKGMITRTLDPNDRRSVIVGLTKKAAEYEKMREKEGKAWIASMIDSVG